VSGSGQFDPAAPLTPSGNLRRRQFFSNVALVGATAAALAAVAVLVLVIYAVASRGLSAISFDFIVKAAPDGIGPELVGTGIIVAIATLIAMPIGVMIAVFVTEYAGRRATNAVKLILDLMNGLPSIIIALFVFALFVNHNKQFALAASFALAIIEVPLISRGSQEVLRLVPQSQREAADALGVARWRSTLSIVLPAALGGIVTSTVLAVARAAGETAPLIFVTSLGDPTKYSFNPLEPLPTVPVRIYELSEEANPAGFTEAWGLSLVLIALILFASLGARALLARSKRKMTAS
jgi:phosphate transport system permease protein